MDELDGIAEANGLWIVEDAAESHGAHYRGRPTGSLGSIGVFSFYGNKIVSSGEGGALTVNDPALEARIRLFRGQGMDPARRYWFPVIGYNYRLTNVACAILCAQLERLNASLAARQLLFERYRERLESVEGLGFQPVAPWADPAPWLFCVTVDAHRFGRSRDELAELLALAGIETRPFFHPLHHLPPYRQDAGPNLPVTERLAATGLNLPTYVGLTDEDLDRVVEVIVGAERGPR
jgi:perosamine synthetase